MSRKKNRRRYHKPSKKQQEAERQELDSLSAILDQFEEEKERKKRAERKERNEKLEAEMKKKLEAAGMRWSDFQEAMATEQKDSDARRRAVLDEKFEKWLLQQLYVAYLSARKGKRRTDDEFAFEACETENLMLLMEDIIARTYKPARGIAFIVFRPVIREIFAAPFRDRVVHHFLYNMVYDWWDRRLCYDSYSCREGKGTSFGINRMAKHIQHVSKNYTRETYVIKLDIQGYFMSLPRKGLYERIMWGLERQFPNKGRVYDVCKYLWREIIFDDPCVGVKRRGSPLGWRLLPRSKSLFRQPEGRGIVIGNLSSQLLSNIYLDPFDRFVRMELGYKHYGRYVDDFYIVVTKKQLPQALKDIKVMEDYLRGLGLTLHPRKRYVQEIHRGIPFLGVVIYPGRIVPGKRVRAFFNQAARMSVGSRDYRASMTSYMGYMMQYSGKTAIKRVFDSMGWRYRF